jgi:predicted GH43/DUF377 family glycosyl hydrolase
MKLLSHLEDNMKTKIKIINGLFILLLIVGIILISGCLEEEPIKERPPESVTKGEEISWTKYPENPLIQGDRSSSWAQLIGDPFVMKDNSVYKMWYGAYNEVTDICRIGYATSEDGINWIQYPTPVVPVGPDGSWDDVNAETPTVIKNADGTYELWYSGTGAHVSEWLKDGEPNFEVFHKIGHATSEDGINWIKDPKNPVMDIDTENQDKWDWLAVADPSVIKEGNVYKMWYTGASLNKDDKIILQIGYATSTDGINWERYEGNPVLPLGKEGSWDAGSVMQPSVFFDGEKYIMLYAGSDEPEEAFGSIGYAISNDGVNWERLSEPILTKGKANSWDSYGLWGPTGMFDESIYKMWYTGLNENIQTGIGYATGEKENGK